MCRHTVGLNWTAIGIEHVGYSDQNPRHLRPDVREPAIGAVAALPLPHRRSERDRAQREPLEPVPPRGRPVAAHQTHDDFNHVRHAGSTVPTHCRWAAARNVNRGSPVGRHGRRSWIHSSVCSSTPIVLPHSANYRVDASAQAACGPIDRTGSPPSGRYEQPDHATQRTRACDAHVAACAHRHGQSGRRVFARLRGGPDRLWDSPVGLPHRPADTGAPAASPGATAKSIWRRTRSRDHLPGSPRPNQPTRAITMTVEHHLVYHSHYAVMWGFPGNIMKIRVRVRASNDPECQVGTIGHATLFASYNGVRSDSVQFWFPAAAGTRTTCTTEHRSTTRCRRCSPPFSAGSLGR